jgi:hypothetical protein
VDRDFRRVTWVRIRLICTSECSVGSNGRTGVSLEIKSAIHWFGFSGSATGSCAIKQVMRCGSVISFFALEPKDLATWCASEKLTAFEQETFALPQIDRLYSSFEKAIGTESAFFVGLVYLMPFQLRASLSLFLSFYIQYSTLRF